MKAVLQKWREAKGGETIELGVEEAEEHVNTRDTSMNKDLESLRRKEQEKHKHEHFGEN